MFWLAPLLPDPLNAGVYQDFVFFNLFQMLEHPSGLQYSDVSFPNLLLQLLSPTPKFTSNYWKLPPRYHVGNTVTIFKTEFNMSCPWSIIKITPMHIPQLSYLLLLHWTYLADTTIIKSLFTPILSQAAKQR